MAYRIDPAAPVQSEVRRIALEQIDKGLAETDAPDDLDHAIHQGRKRCKKLRGLIRLVRPVFDAYTAENAFLRDAAKPLSPLRDRAALIETYDTVAEAYGDRIDRRAMAPLRRHLTLMLKELHRTCNGSEKVAQLHAELRVARRRAEAWTIDAKGFDAIADGLSKTWGRARKAMTKVQDSRASADMHEWRKRMKYHWYHARLLRRIAPQLMPAHIDAADRLADVLGNHHDIAVLFEHLGNTGLADRAAVLAGLASQRQDWLAECAFDQGKVLLSENRQALRDRWRGYWEA